MTSRLRPFLTSDKDVDQNIAESGDKETFAKKRRSKALLVQKEIADGRTDTQTWNFYSLYRDTFYQLF